MKSNKEITALAIAMLIIVSTLSFMIFGILTVIPMLEGTVETAGVLLSVPFLLIAGVTTLAIKQLTEEHQEGWCIYLKVDTSGRRLVRQRCR